MADIETGLKWWIRYVIVPVIAGGGVIALVVGLLAGNRTERPPVAVATPAQGTNQSKTVPAEASRKASLNVAVDPDTVGISVGSLSAIHYRFRELAGIDATVESQDVQWILTDGTVLRAEKGNRILGGSFTVPARGDRELLDNVYLPPDIASEVRKRGEDKVQLVTIFNALDPSDHPLHARAVLRIVLSGG